MNLFVLALRNQQRRPFRTLVSMAGVAICVATLFSLLAFQRGYREGMQSELDRLGAHILIVPKGCPYDAASIALHGARWPCHLEASYVDQIRRTYGVATAAPEYMDAFYDDSGGQTVYVGVERNILLLKRGWHIHGSFPSSPEELLIGGDIARRRGWHIGQRVSLPEMAGKVGRVSGVLDPTSGPDDTFIYLPLAQAQRLFDHPGELTDILVRLKDPDDLETTVSQLHQCGAGLDMNVVPLAHLFDTIRTVVNSTRILLGAIAAIALLIAGAGVTNTVLMAVVERTSEIGVMRGLGASRWQIFELFWLETIQVCLAGSAAGIGGAYLASRSVESWLRSRLPFAPVDPLIRWEWWVVLSCLACGLVLGSLAGVLPAWRAASLAPVEAIRS